MASPSLTLVQQHEEFEGEEEKVFNFLGLPKDLRLEIYEYLLVPRQSSFYKFEGDGKNENMYLTGFHANVESSGNTQFYECSRHNELHPQILQSCQAIYKEAEDLLYRPEVLELSPSRRFFSSHFRPHVIDDETFSRLHQVEMLVLFLDVGYSKGHTDIRHSQALAKALHRDMGMHTANIRITALSDCETSASHNSLASAYTGMIYTWADLLKTFARISFFIQIGGIYVDLSKIGDVWEEKGVSDGLNDSDDEGGKALRLQHPLVDQYSTNSDLESDIGFHLEWRLGLAANLIKVTKAAFGDSSGEGAEVSVSALLTKLEAS